MRNSLLIIFFSLVIVSCNKDTFTTVPQIKFKSVNTTVLAENQLLQITLTLTDKEGDVAGGLLYVHKIVPHCPLSEFYDSIPLPDFPTNADQQGDILVTYANGTNVGNGSTLYTSVGSPACGVDDTCYFRFRIKDNAQHLSDSIQTGNIIIKQ